MDFKIPSLEYITNTLKATKECIFDPHREHFIHRKGESDFVTETDIAVQKYLAQKLRAEYPSFGFFGEEDEVHDLDPKKPTWVVDPIDGTTNFIHHFSLSGVSLALVYDKTPLVGAVYNPFTDEMFSAKHGGGAYYNGVRVHVTDIADISASMIGVGTAPYYKEETTRLFALYERLFREAVDIRRIGSAALDVCYVAIGRTDAFIEYRLNAWDFAASSLILTEAGGKITQWNGSPLAFGHYCSVAASNGLLHEAVIERTREYLPDTEG